MAFERKKKSYKLDVKKLPTKRTINLAGKEKQSIRIGFVVPGVLVTALVLGLFVKFAIINRYAKLAEAQQEVELVQTQLNMGYRKIQSFGDITEKYSHYTYSDFTEEELNRTDRVEILKVLNQYVYTQAAIGAWYLVGNECTLPITGSTLQEVNEIVQDLEKSDLVGYCTVNTAATGDLSQSTGALINGGERDTSVVTAQVKVYFNNSTLMNYWEAEQ